MSRQCFVLNEWVLYDVAGNDGPGPQETALRLFQQIKRQGDQIAVLVGSPWMQKAYTLMKEANLRIRRISKFLQLEILRDPNVCKLVQPDDVSEVPSELKQRTPPDDLYLIETYLAAGATKLVTTDEGLCEALNEVPRLSITLKDGFLNEYLSE